MTKTLVALFDDFEVAVDALEDLMEAGYPRDEMSLVASDYSGTYAQYVNRDPMPVRVSQDVSGGEGASVGAVLGGLIGLGAALIPGVGPVLAAGPVAAALLGGGVGAATGAVTGGIVASLVNFGVSEDDAQYYAESIRRGGAVLSISVTDEKAADARQIIQRHHPVNFDERGSYYRESGWAGFDLNASPYTREQIETERTQYKNIWEKAGEATKPDASVREYDWARKFSTMPSYKNYENDFRQHYHQTYASTGYGYDRYSPAYEYGSMLASDPRWRESRSWDEVEVEARRGWQERSQDAWEDVKDAVRTGWNKVKNVVS